MWGWEVVAVVSEELSGLGERAGMSSTKGLLVGGDGQSLTLG